MKKTKVVLSLILISICSIANSQNNNRDIEHIQKFFIMDTSFVKHNISYDNDTIISIKGITGKNYECLYDGEWTVYYDNENKKPCYYIKTNKETNECYQLHWYRNGYKESESYSIGWDNTGFYKTWYKNGQLEWIRNYSSNPDTSFSYFNNGVLQSEEIYFNNLIVKKKEFNKSGNLDKEIFYNKVNTGLRVTTNPVSGIKYNEDGSPLGYFTYVRDTIVTKEYNKEFDVEAIITQVVESIRVDTLK